MKTDKKRLRDLLAALDAASDGVALASPDLKLEYANRALCDMAECERPEEMIGREVADFVTAETFAVIRARAMAGELVGQAPFVEGVLRGVRGRLVPVEYGTSVLRDEEGKPYGFLAIIRDITARQRAEEALHRSETKFRTLYDSSSDAVMLLDEKGFFDCNKATLAIFGCATEEEFCSKHPADLSPPEQPCGTDSLTLANERIATAMKEGSNRFEWIHKRNDTGETFPAEVLLNALELDGKPVLQAVVRDITERKQVEHHLRERMKELQALYGLAEVAEREGITLDKLYQESTNILPKGWQYPEIACARIVIGDSEFRTENFAESPWKQSSPVKVNGSVVGRIDVGYLEQKPEEDEGPFLKEERRLIDAIAERIGDTAEHRQAEQTQARLAAILGATPDFVGFADAKDTHILYINPAGRKMVGVGAQEDVTRLKIADVHPEWTNRLFRDEIIPTAIRDGIWTGECALLNRDSREIPVMMVLLTHKSPSGEVERFSTISRDITARKRAEEALRASEAHHRTLLATLPQKIFCKDRNSVYLYCNSNYARDLGIATHEIVGRTDYDFHPEDLADKYRSDDQRVMESGQTEELEERYRQGGREYIVHTIKTPLKDEAGNVVGVLGVFSDITARKRAEQELEAKNQELESFVYTVSHDLRAPLVSLEGFARLLVEGYEERLDAEGQDYLRRLRTNVGVMNSLLTDLLELSRVGRRQEPAQAVAMSEVVAEALESLAELVGRSGAKLEVAADLPLVWYSRLALSQVFVNLISNAIKFSREGEIPRVEIGWEKRPGGCRFHVTDNGIGIPTEHRQRLFEIFGRLKQKPVEGTGIGLAIVKRIVESNGGEVGVDSRPGEGSTFWFTVPDRAEGS